MKKNMIKILSITLLLTSIGLFPIQGTASETVPAEPAANREAPLASPEDADLGSIPQAVPDESATDISTDFPMNALEKTPLPAALPEDVSAALSSYPQSDNENPNNSEEILIIEDSVSTGPTAVSSDTPSPAPSSDPITAITLNHTELKLGRGGTAVLSVAASSQDALMEPVYTSSDEAVATVDQQGVVTGKANGQAVITAALSDNTALCRVMVGQPLTSLSLTFTDDNSYTLSVDQKRKITYTAAPENALNSSVAFSTDKPEVIDISDDGILCGKKPGTATVTLTAADGTGLSQVLTVKVTKRKNGTSSSNAGFHIVDISKAKYTYDEMEHDLKELEQVYGDRIQVDTIGTTYDDRNLYHVILGNPDAPKKIMIQSSMHAREYMCTLLTMRDIEFYCRNYYTGIYEGTYFSELFDDVSIHFVPMTNPDGVAISQFGPDGINDPTLKKNIRAMCKKYGNNNSYYYTRWKANGRGVDLNRNFDAYWALQKDKEKAPCSAGYPGKSAESEKEAQAVMELAYQLDPEAIISYHSTGSILYWYYGQNGDLLTRSQELVDILQDLTGYRKIYSYTKTASAGFGDWASVVLKKPTVTIEIGTGICPLKISEFNSIWSKNRMIPAATAALYY